MTETSPPYGDQPVIPSTRVTEAELLGLDRITGGWGPAPTTVEIPAELFRRLVAEIRRYRALLIALNRLGAPAPRTAMGTGKEWPGVPAGQFVPGNCWYCGRWQSGENCAAESAAANHAESCPWPELEAEVQAIRAEREMTGTPAAGCP